jgi:hypothetical protein
VSSFLAPTQGYWQAERSFLKAGALFEEKAWSFLKATLRVIKNNLS